MNCSCLVLEWDTKGKNITQLPGPGPAIQSPISKTLESIGLCCMAIRRRSILKFAEDCYTTRIPEGVGTLVKPLLHDGVPYTLVGNCWQHFSFLVLGSPSSASLPR